MANTTKKQPEIPPQDTPVPFGMTDYFKQGVLPLSVSGGKKVVTRPRPRIQNEYSFFLLVTGGTGRMIVNNESFRLRRGMMLCLGPFHNYSIAPDPGVELSYYDAYMNAGAYMFVLSCPYLKINELNVPSEAVWAQLSEKETLRTEHTMKSIGANAEKSSYKNKLDFLYIMELYGVLIAKASERKREEAEAAAAADPPEV